MKQTAMTISMIDNNYSNYNGEQRMTSVEIAELTGKQHKNVMRDIRNMEPAWENIAGLKFELGCYEDVNGQSRPCYFLTKTECLYIATKFNDEARARLVLRWEELEVAQKRLPPCAPKEIRLLTCDEEVLDEADEIIGDELDELNRYSDGCYTPSEIGRVFGIDGRDLNSFLADMKIIRWSRGQWRLTKKYANQGYTENRSFIYHGRNGRRKLESRLVWTEKGRDFVMDLIRG